MQNFKDFDESNAQVARDISDKFENNYVARKKKKKRKKRRNRRNNKYILAKDVPVHTSRSD